jgi:CRP-like cAMP-binding protein
MNYEKYIEKASEHLDMLLKTDLKDYIQLSTFKKNELLLSQGDICRYYLFLKEGITRSFYIKDGTEITSNFTFPNDVSTVFRSLVLQEPSNEYIQAITNCAVYQMKISDFAELKNQHPVLKKVEKIFITAYTMQLEERLFSVQFHTAVERYSYLMEHYPQYLRFIPLKYIASFLGVTIETLSRVRAKKR